jgi:hypothetical protein
LIRRSVLAGAVLLACGGPPGTVAESPLPVASDSTRLLVPVGYGTLRQDEIALRLREQRLQVRAIPLDETVIRVLSPDSYRNLTELVASQRSALDALSRRTGLRQFNLWYVSFFALEQGDTRFSPMEFIISSTGRDFRPIEVLPITAGFGAQRLGQRETQSAVYAFDPLVDVNQPLSVQYETSRNDDWGAVLSRIERERALVRSRAGVKGAASFRE